MENYEVLEELHNVEAEIEDVQGAFFLPFFFQIIITILMVMP